MLLITCSNFNILSLCLFMTTVLAYLLMLQHRYFKATSVFLKIQAGAAAKWANLCQFSVSFYFQSGVSEKNQKTKQFALRCSNLVHCNVGTAGCKASEKSDWVLKTATFLFRFSSVHLQGVKIMMQNNIFIRLLFLIAVSQNIFATTTTKVTEVHLVVHKVHLDHFLNICFFILRDFLFYFARGLAVFRFSAVFSTPRFTLIKLISFTFVSSPLSTQPPLFVVPCSCLCRAVFIPHCTKYCIFFDCLLNIKQFFFIGVDL